MSHSIYAGHLCATHVGQQLVAIDDELVEPPSLIKEVHHVHRHPIVGVLVCPIHSGKTRFLHVDPRAVITFND